MTINNKRILSFILCLSMIFALCSNTLYTNASDMNIENYDLIAIAEWIENKPETRSNNTPPPTVTILQNTETIQEVKFQEGTKCNIVLYNKVTDELFIDGGLVTVTETTPKITTRGLQEPINHSYRNVEFEQELMQLTVSALIAAIIFALKVAHPIASFFASEIASKCVSSGYGYSRCTYCHSYRRISDDFQYYVNYWDRAYESFSVNKDL